MIRDLLLKLAGWKGYALTAGLSLALGFGGGWKLRDWQAAEAAQKAARAETRALQKTLAIERGAARASADIGAKVEARTEAVRTVTRTIIERVPAYVSPAADARCVLPLGFVRVHDAAALGLSPAPAAAGQSDEAASGLELSDVARTVAGNYGICHEAVEQVTGWQDFYRELQARMDGSGER